MNKLENVYISQEAIVPGGFGGAFHAAAGQKVTITDLKGKQVVDLVAFVSSNLREHLSMSHTAFGLGRLYLQKGDLLVTNLQNPIIEVLNDTTNGFHDMTAHMCDPQLYKNYGVETEHRSCRQNLSEVLKPYGIENVMLPDPLNIFQHTPNIFRTSPDDNREVTLGGTSGSYSKAGDYITIRFLTDTIFAVSSCPFDLEGFNGGEPTSIKITLE